MATSCLACNYDRNFNDLATIQVRSQDHTIGGSYKLRWLVEMAGACGPLMVLKQGLTGSPNALPNLWATYAWYEDTDTNSFCKKLTVDFLKAEESRRFFLVTGNYEPTEPGEIPDGGGSPINATADPIARKPVFWWDREVHTHLNSIDKDGKVIKNFGNNLYPDLVETERTRGILVAEFNVRLMSEVNDYIRGYDHSVNLNDFALKGSVFPPRSVNIKEVSGSDLHCDANPVTGTTYTYYTVRMRMSLAPTATTFDVPLPEMGQSYFTKTGGAYDLDPQGYRKRGNAGTLIPLESDGTRRADGDPILATNWRVSREVDYSPLSTILNR